MPRYNRNSANPTTYDPYSGSNNTNPREGSFTDVYMNNIETPPRRRPTTTHGTFADRLLFPNRRTAPIKRVILNTKDRIFKPKYNTGGSWFNRNAGNLITGGMGLATGNPAMIATGAMGILGDATSPEIEDPMIEYNNQIKRNRHYDINNKFNPDSLYLQTGGMMRNNNMFKLRGRGGNYNIESEEGIFGRRKMAQGGVLRPEASNVAVAEGNTHEQGGIQLPGAEIENNESIVQSPFGGETQVHSDELGYADQTNQLADIKGELEYNLQEVMRKMNALTKEMDNINSKLEGGNINTLQRNKIKREYQKVANVYNDVEFEAASIQDKIQQIDMEIENNFQEQEAMAQQMGMRDEQGMPVQEEEQPMFQTGGMYRTSYKSPQGRNYIFNPLELEDINMIDIRGNNSNIHPESVQNRYNTENRIPTITKEELDSISNSTERNIPLGNQTTTGETTQQPNRNNIAMQGYSIPSDISDVREFQTNTGISSDGIWGPESQAMYEQFNRGQQDNRTMPTKSINSLPSQSINPIENNHFEIDDTGWYDNLFGEESNITQGNNNSRGNQNNNWENALPFMSNAFNAFAGARMNRQRTPQGRMLQTPTMDPTVNINPQKDAIRSQVKAGEESITGSTSNASIARANRANLNIQGGRAEADIISQADNTSRQIRNHNLDRMAQTDMYNQQTDLQNQMMTQQADTDRWGRMSANIANIESKLQQFVGQDRLKEFQDAQLALYDKLAGDTSIPAELKLAIKDVSSPEEFIKLLNDNNISGEYREKLINEMTQLLSNK